MALAPMVPAPATEYATTKISEVAGQDYYKNYVKDTNYYFYTDPQYPRPGEQTKVIFVVKEEFPDFNLLDNFSALNIVGNSIEVTSTATKFKRNCVKGDDVGVVISREDIEKYEFDVGKLSTGNYAFSLRLRSLFEKECGEEPVVESEKSLEFNFKVREPFGLKEPVIEEKFPIIASPPTEMTSESGYDSNWLRNREGRPGQPLTNYDTNNLVAERPLTSFGTPSGKIGPVTPGWKPKVENRESEDPSKADYNEDAFITWEDLPEEHGPGTRMPDVIEPTNQVPEKTQTEAPLQQIVVGIERAFIEKNGNETRIVSNGITATTTEKVEVDNNQLKLGGKTLAVTPSTAAQKASEALGETTIQSITIHSGERPIYVVETKKKAMLFGILPIEMETKASIDAKSSQVISIEKPWWSFLVG